MGNKKSCPDIKDYKKVIDLIYENRFFTNHGPLATAFESSIENCLFASNAVAIGNESLALLIAIKGWFDNDIDGEINVLFNSLFDNPVISDAVKMSGIKYNLLDIESFGGNSENIKFIVVSDSDFALLDQEKIRSLSDFGTKIIVFSEKFPDKKICKNENTVVVFSLDSDSHLSTLEGGVIVTNDDNLAKVFRNIRSSYGSREKVKVIATCNGRFSELQAGLGLLGLERGEII